ncbi:zinc chelation protein SecC [Mycobacterium sp. IS-1590]|uniref:YchJ family protein n=1 Tax=Mycobacterium sp. IS-1590 TaxID=1772286 RepID=UPI000749185A|nr:YchJ family metal-binding protein [Mycobacterium sp. IS-1590]KUI34377.1 zinc chelation protein SecC [Mycobacterium sp. IS-1590]
MAQSDNCPCGSGGVYSACCEPLHDGARVAATAAELMRSRYSAFVKGVEDYLFSTWHPRTRPPDVTVDREMTWTGLEINDVVCGSETDDHGEVEFTARYIHRGQPGTMHERSRFERRAGRWFYVEAV